MVVACATPAQLCTCHRPSCYGHLPGQQEQTRLTQAHTACQQHSSSIPAIHCQLHTAKRPDQAPVPPHPHPHRHLEEREREKQLELIKQQYLGVKEYKKRSTKPSERMKFVFDWGAEEDTSRDLNPLYNNLHGGWPRLALLLCPGLRRCCFLCCAGCLPAGGGSANLLL